VADESTERDDEVEAHQFEGQAELNQFEGQAELNQLEGQAELNRDEGPDVEGHRQMETQIEYQIED
jgi:hypothetical protein